MDVFYLKVLKDASIKADKDHSIDGSYKHAMRAPYETVEEAKESYDNFLNEKIQKFANTKDYAKALRELGLGMHAIMDSWAPSHTGFQVWNGIGMSLNSPFNIVAPIINFIKGGFHSGGEIDNNIPFLNSLTDKKIKLISNDLQRYYNRAMEIRNKQFKK